MDEPALKLDWSAYAHYGDGDAYALLPTHGGGFGRAAAVCIGSRTCQRADAKGVMCPSFRVTQDVSHSTQHRAATLRAAMNGELGERPFDDPQLSAAMDLCVACKGCKRECPNGVDMALLRTEVLAQRWRGGAMPLRERLFARLPQWVPLLRRLGAAGRALMALRERVPLLARLGERWLGLAAARRLPRPAPRAFLDQAAPAATEGRDVLLLVDTFSNHFDPEIAEAAVQVLQAAGCRVHLLRPPTAERALCCGRTAWSAGDIAGARHEAQRVLAALAPHAGSDWPLIGLEPSCLLMLRDEYLALGLGEAAVAWSKRAWLLEEFLARELKPEQLPLQALAQPVHVHGHCHQKAFGAMKALRKVLGWVPELQVEMIDSSCCGMAGSFGFEAEHHAVSMQMAEAALLPALRQAPADAWVLANGSSCRQQISDGAGRRAVHLAQLLRAALPEAAR